MKNRKISQKVYAFPLVKSTRQFSDAFKLCLDERDRQTEGWTDGRADGRRAINVASYREGCTINELAHHQQRNKNHLVKCDY